MEATQQQTPSTSTGAAPESAGSGSSGYDSGTAPTSIVTPTSPSADGDAAITNAITSSLAEVNDDRRFEPNASELVAPRDEMSDAVVGGLDDAGAQAVAKYGSPELKAAQSAADELRAALGPLYTPEIGAKLNQHLAGQRQELATMREQVQNFDQMAQNSPLELIGALADVEPVRQALGNLIREAQALAVQQQRRQEPQPEAWRQADPALAQYHAAHVEPLRREIASQKILEGARASVAKQIQAASSLPHFSELVESGAILNELKRDPSASLETAYHRTMRGRLLTDRTKMREEILSELNGLPRSTSTVVRNPTPSGSLEGLEAPDPVTAAIMSAIRGSR
jgi:hypothetical protein